MDIWEKIALNRLQQKIKNFFYHHSIKEEIFYPLLGLFFLGFFVSAFILYFGGNYLLEKNAYHTLTNEKGRFLDNIEEKRKFLKQLAILLANDEVVKDCIANRNKEKLKRHIFFILNELKEEGESYSLIINFFLTPTTPFLSAGEVSYGKDIRKLRQMSAFVNEKHALASGFEVTQEGIKLKAVAPISYTGAQKDVTWIGMVELALDLREIVKRFPLEENEGIILYLPSKFEKLLSHQGNFSEYPFWTSLNLPLELFSKFKQSLVRASSRGVKIKHYLLTAFSLSDFQGHEIAQIVLLKDIYPLLQQRNSVLLVLSFMFFIAFAITLGVTWFGLNQITQRITELRESIISLLKGDFSKKVPISFKIQCWEILNCHNTNCPVYKDNNKVCFLVTGDLALVSPYKGSCQFLKKYGTCQNCPVMIKRTKNEMNSLICWYNDLFDTLASFFNKINHRLSEMLNNPQNEETESLILRVEQIVNEMLQMTRFRETLETFRDKEEIYQYLKWFLLFHFKINNFIIYEVNNSENRFEIVVNEGREYPNKIFPDLLLDCNLCPVKRNSQPLSSLDYPNVCAYAYIDSKDFFHYCLPIMMGGRVGAVLKMVIKKERAEEIQRKIPFIRKYLEEVAPILEAKRALAVARQQALRDQLTGLYNRRFMDEYLVKWNLLLRRQRGKASVLMLDLDHFKKINDTYGHHTGDLVLKKLAYILQTNLRASDLIFRYGGEEILVFLPEATKKDAIAIAEKLRRAVEIAEFEISSQRKIKITISVGVASYPDDSDELQEVIKLADKTLYVAKQEGRNRVVSYKVESG